MAGAVFNFLEQTNQTTINAYLLGEVLKMHPLLTAALMVQKHGTDAFEIVESKPSGAEAIHRGWSPSTETDLQRA